MVYCSKCKKRNDTGSKYCIFCGEPIKEDAKEVITNRTTLKRNVTNTKNIVKRNKKIAILIISALFFIPFIIGLFSTLFEYRTLKKDERFSNDGWEITYVIPKGFKTERKYDDNLRFYDYETRDNDIDCHITIWRMTYLDDNKTPEDIMKDHSYIYPKSLIVVKQKEINKKEWYSIELEEEFDAHYEYGLYSKKKDNFYYISFEDNTTENVLCKKQFDKILKSIKYK